jgi:hypothetical protein
MGTTCWGDSIATFASGSKKHSGLVDQQDTFIKLIIEEPFYNQLTQPIGKQ